MSGRDEEWQRATPEGVGEKKNGQKGQEKIDKKREEEMK